MQLFSVYYLLYKEMSFLGTLTSISVFERSVTLGYNLDFFGRDGYKNDANSANKKKFGNSFFMQASDCVINYLNKNKFFVALSTICDIF